jgi:hypothetical protein
MKPTSAGKGSIEISFLRVDSQSGEAASFRALAAK